MEYVNDSPKLGLKFLSKVYTSMHTFSTTSIIVYDDSLGMPNGKVIAQLSHAICAVILGCFDFNEHKFKSFLAKDILLDLINTLVIEKGTKDSLNHRKFTVVIEDQGRTVFKGVPTKTCAILVPEAICEKLKFSNNFYEAQAQDCPTRLLQLVDKSYARKNLQETIVSCVRQQALHLLNALEAEPLTKESALKSWATGSFAKVVLSAKQFDLQKIQDLSTTTNTPISFKQEDGYIQHCTIGPVFKGELNEHTQHLKMM